MLQLLTRKTCYDLSLLDNFLKYTSIENLKILYPWLVKSRSCLSLVSRAKPLQVTGRIPKTIVVIFPSSSSGTIGFLRVLFLLQGEPQAQSKTKIISKRRNPIISCTYTIKSYTSYCILKNQFWNAIWNGLFRIQS